MTSEGTRAALAPPPSDQDPTDAHVVSRALSGSQAAYREIVRRYQRPLLNLIAQIVRDRAEAEDLTQEVFVKAFRALDRYDPARRFSSWLFTIAHNHALDRLRTVHGVTLSIDSDEVPDVPSAPVASPADLAERARLADALGDALGRLRVEYRAAVVLRYQEDLTQQEIAEVMGVPEGTVKTYLHRARKELAREMTARGWGPLGRGGGV